MDELLLPSDFKENVQRALAEDVGTGDVNAQLIPASKQVTARLISRESAILCGTAWFTEVFSQLDSQIQIVWQIQEGEKLTPNQLVCDLTGNARALLTGERTALNFLQLLSGTATQVRRYVEAVQGTKARILDTRKTIPHLRSAQKYAVRCAGGTNHRMGLYDAFLIKENHIIAAGSITQAVEAARQLAPHLLIEVEVETLTQIQEALPLKVERLLLDNFDLALLRKAVQLVAGKISLEASGGITLNTVRKVAETGVDYISIGAMTKEVKAVDFSMRMVNF